MRSEAACVGGVGVGVGGGSGGDGAYLRKPVRGG